MSCGEYDEHCHGAPTLQNWAHHGVKTAPLLRENVTLTSQISSGGIRMLFGPQKDMSLWPKTFFFFDKGKGVNEPIIPSINTTVTTWGPISHITWCPTSHAVLTVLRWGAWQCGCILQRQSSRFCCQDPASPLPFLVLNVSNEYSIVLTNICSSGNGWLRLFGVTGKVFSHTLDKNHHFSFKSKSQNISSFFNILQERFIILSVLDS